MRIAVLGTGIVGRTLAGRLAELGHEVVVGTRDVGKTTARPVDGADGPTFGDWLTVRPTIHLAALAESVSDADLVVNATSGSATLDCLAEVGEANLAGRVLLDVANPLDFSGGFPPLLTICNTDSLGEQVQRAFPAVRVVKSLNTLTADLMARPELIGDGEHSLFVCGDDPDAKATVTALLTHLGHRDVIDLGGITSARGTEMFLALWVRTMSALGTAAFNIKVVR
jgi:predicted dinucleotide-binding enzyme